MSELTAMSDRLKRIEDLLGIAHGDPDDPTSPQIGTESLVEAIPGEWEELG